MSLKSQFLQVQTMVIIMLQNSSLVVTTGMTLPMKSGTNGPSRRVFGTNKIVDNYSLIM